MLFNHITSRIPTDPLPNLLGQKGGSGFPHLVFMDETGLVVARQRGPREVADFRKLQEEAQAALQLRDQAKAGDPAAQFAWLVRILELQPLPAAEVAAQVQAIGDLTSDQKSRLDPLLVTNDFKDAMITVTQDVPTQVEAGRKLAAMADTGRIPADKRDATNFWGTIATFAEHTKDKARFARAFESIKTLVPKTPNSEIWYAKMEAKLKELEGGN